MNIEEIRKNKPDNTASHYLTIMFLGLVYIKYINGFPNYFDNSGKHWSKCNYFFEAKPL